MDITPHPSLQEPEHLLSPLEEEDDRGKQHKWLRVLFVLLALQYLQQFYYAILNLRSYWMEVVNCMHGNDKTIVADRGFLKCALYSVEIWLFVDLFRLFFIPVVFALLMKKKRWGWILLCVDNMAGLFSALTVCITYLTFGTGSINNGQLVLFILGLIFRGMITFLLFSRSVVSYYRINRRTKVVAAFSGIIFCLLTAFITFLITWLKY